MVERIKVMMKVFEKIWWERGLTSMKMSVWEGRKERGMRRKNYHWEGGHFPAPHIMRGGAKGSTLQQRVHTCIHTFEGFLPVTQVSGSLKSGRR